MSDIIPAIEKYPRLLVLALLANRLLDLPAWKATIWHVDSVDSSFLDAMAEEWAITDTAAWQSANTDAERRALIQGAEQRHRERGTLAGMRRAVEEAGGRIRSIIAPPNKFFLSSTATVAERNAWLARHPEIRLYPRRVRGQREVAMLGSTYLGSGCHAARSTALARSRLRATLLKDGVETELETPSWEIATVNNDAVTEIIIPSRRGHASFLGTPIRYTAATDASNRRIVLKSVTPYTEKTAKLGLRSVQPQLEPIDTDGQMIYQRRSAPAKASFNGRFARFSVRLNAEQAIYRRIKLFDPTVPAVRARAASHLGHGRLGMPPHTAHIEVAFYGQRNLKWGRYCGQPVVKSDQAPLQKLLDNMRLAKRKSDKILVSTKTFRPVKMGRVQFGTQKMGGVTNK